MSSIDFHTSQLSTLIKGLGIAHGRIFAMLAPYYLLTIVGTLLEGVSMIMLIAVFTGGTGLVTQSGLPSFALEPLQSLLDGSQLPRLLLVLISLLGICLLIRLGLIFVEGLIGAILRRKIQEAIFKRLLHGDWAHMRNFRVGDAVGTNTQEAMVVSKYMVSAVTALYYLLGAAVMGGLALLASLKVALGLGCIALPLAVLVQKIFSVQARLSRRSAELRNEFSSDITDRLNGLLQVQVDNNFKYHEERGLHTQPKLSNLEIKIGACQAVIGSFSLLMIFTALLGFSLWMQFFGATDIPDLGLIASVGVLGLKAAGQLNGLVGAVGNLSRLSGSLYPVIDALNVPARLPRQAIDEPIAGIEANSINYSYDTLLVIDKVSLKVKRGEPLVLRGRSGKGKTTLANLLAGLYVPEAGEIVYIGESGRRYSGNQYYAKVGFVTQDIYLFQGTLRENLTAGRDCADAEVWKTLEQVDAADFVRQLGGLNIESVEAGRALSGGQRRRLGVARVLLSGAEVLIFDEVTAGLDQANKTAVISVIEWLSGQYSTVLISHDPLSLAGQTTFTV